ncbi:MAG: hypothetical protein KDA92_00575 [Planctomycetales bacterium]|nr:hypothetical protein [Planctomycetales bacterium]
MNANTNANGESGLSFNEGKRSLLSLFIFLHLFCVAVGMFSNESRSRLSLELRRVLGPYLRTLDLDPQFPAEFQVTHAMDYDDDHQWVVELPDGTVQGAWPTDISLADRVDFRLRRWQQLTRKTTLFLEEENDTGIAELVRTIATEHFADSDANRLVIRCRRYRPTSWEEPAPPDEDNTAARFADVYVADATRDEQGVVRVLKRVAANEAAQVRRNNAAAPHGAAANAPGNSE